MIAGVCAGGVSPPGARVGVGVTPTGSGVPGITSGVAIVGARGTSASTMVIRVCSPAAVSRATPANPELFSSRKVTAILPLSSPPSSPQAIAASTSPPSEATMALGVARRSVIASGVSM
jgi:hypothetical protein